MTDPFDAAPVSPANAVVPSPEPSPTDAAAVPGILADVARTKRLLLGTFWTMAAVYVASVAYALSLGPDARDYAQHRFSRGPQATAYYGICLVVIVLVFLWMMSFFLARPRPPTAASLPGYLKTTRRTGCTWIVVFMALWCVWPHQYRLGFVRTSQPAPLDGIAHPLGAQFAFFVCRLLADALVFARTGASAARPFEPTQSEIDESAKEGRLYQSRFVFGAYALATLPSPWLFASLMAPNDRLGFASKGPPLWVYTAAYWAAFALGRAAARRISRSASGVEWTCDVVQLICLIFVAINFTTRRISEDPTVLFLGALQIGTMAVASLWRGVGPDRTTTAKRAEGRTT